MPTGMVKWFNEAKNYGFIIPDEGGKDIFFHRSDMRAHVLREGQKVTFTIEEGRKGAVAVNVTPEDGTGNFYDAGPSYGGGGGYRDDYDRGDYYNEPGDYPPPPRQSYQEPAARPAAPPPAPRRSGGPASMLISDAKSICHAAEELSLMAHDETGNEQVLNLGALIRSVRDKLDEALDILATKDY